MNPVTFTPRGPYEVAYSRTKAGTSFDTDQLWSAAEAGPLATKSGCYILAVKRGKTMMPIYVGLTRARFDREIFNPSNRAKYHRALQGGKKYRLFLLLLEHPGHKKDGRPKYIGEIENFFITAGFARNPALENSKGRPRPVWQVPHVTVPAKGKPTRAARALRAVMGLEGTSHHAYAGRAFKSPPQGHGLTER